MPETLENVLAMAIALWGTVSLFCILIPFRPLPTRGRAAKSFGLSLLAFLLFGLALEPRVQPSGHQIAEAATPQSEAAPGTTGAAPVESDQAGERGSEAALTTDTSPGGDIPAPCGDGGIALADVVAVSGEHELHAAASSDSPRIRNEKASAALGEDHYHRIDGSTTVRRLCAQSEWTEVQIVTPDWLTFVRGWVPNAALREIERTESGARILVADDFYWDDETSEFKAQIVATVNRIAEENSNCSQPDPSSVAKSPSRSKPGDPVFFVTCGSGPDVFNIWFRPGDAEGGAAFAAKEPLGRNAAADACETAARQAAVHPSTVAFSRVWDLAYMPHASGRARVVSSFTAKNALNLELKFRIDCLFDGPALIKTNIAESTD